MGWERNLRFGCAQGTRLDLSTRLGRPVEFRGRCSGEGFPGPAMSTGQMLDPQFRTVPYDPSFPQSDLERLCDLLFVFPADYSNTVDNGTIRCVAEYALCCQLWSANWTSGGGLVAITPVTLWRNGNATSPRLDYVRSSDITTYEIDGKKYVQARSGGVSTFGYSNGPDLLQKNWWSLFQGNEVPKGLTVELDPLLADHYLWEPAWDMPWTDYVGALTIAGRAPPWRKREKTEEEELAGPDGAAALTSGMTTSPTDAERSDAMYASPKTLRFIVAALDTQIRQLTDAIEDETRSEDERSDVANDLALYRLIRQKIQADHDALMREITARASASRTTTGDEPGGGAGA